MDKSFQLITDIIFPEYKSEKTHCIYCDVETTGDWRWTCPKHDDMESIAVDEAQQGDYV